MDLETESDLTLTLTTWESKFTSAEHPNIHEPAEAIKVQVKGNVWFRAKLSV